jgi:hypothetical protein
VFLFCFGTLARRYSVSRGERVPKVGSTIALRASNKVGSFCPAHFSALQKHAEPRHTDRLCTYPRRAPFLVPSHHPSKHPSETQCAAATHASASPRAQPQPHHKTTPSAYAVQLELPACGCFLRECRYPTVFGGHWRTVARSSCDRVRGVHSGANANHTYSDATSRTACTGYGICLAASTRGGCIGVVLLLESKCKRRSRGAVWPRISILLRGILGYRQALLKYSFDQVL